MSILIGCEESQTICGKFRQAGYEAFSCDLEPTRGNPDWHYQADIMEVIGLHRWDLIILHPDCTALSLSGNRWYGKGMPRHSERLKAIAWAVELWNWAKEFSNKVALENPASVIFILMHLYAIPSLMSTATAKLKKPGLLCSTFRILPQATR